jgi:drug/metabolite transporter (DMT)-like permease
MNDSDALARNRFFALSLLRIAGALLIIAGLVIAAGRFESLPPVAGIVMVLVGAVDFALVPLWLARRWRTPK